MSVKKVPVQDEFPFQNNVKDFITDAQRGGLSPAKGDRYILTDGANINKICFYDGAIWQYLTPTEGWLVFDEDSNKYYKFITSWTEYIGQAGPTGPTGPTGATGATGASGTVTRNTFTNASLSAGVLTITHNKGYSAPYSIIIAIFDNNNKQIIPDEVTGATNTVLIDLTSYGVISGTWGFSYVV